MSEKEETESNSETKNMASEEERKPQTDAIGSGSSGACTENLEPTIAQYAKEESKPETVKVGGASTITESIEPMLGQCISEARKPETENDVGGTTSTGNIEPMIAQCKSEERKPETENDVGETTSTGNIEPMIAQCKSEERKPETVNDVGGTTSTGNIEPTLAQCANAESSCGTGTESNLEEGRTTSGHESSVESVAASSTRFARRHQDTRRQYRRRSREAESSGDEQVHAREERSSSDMDVENWPDSLSSSSSDSNLSFIMEQERKRPAHPFESSTYTPKVLLKTKPTHKWFAVKEIVNREVGCGGRWQGGERFQHRYYGSLHAVQRLELMYKLDRHRGCVNSLNFNRSGELLLSASDDKRVVMWDWAANRTILSFDSGHSSNVFQAKFLPLSGDRHIVTCARDGQVRLSVLSGLGLCKATRLLAQHKRTIHKLATHADTPHVFLSAGEDALVLSHDVRTNKATKLLFVKEKDQKIGLYSIHSNPVCSNEFIVTGEDQFIRMYDKRKVSQGRPLKKFCPQHLVKPEPFFHVTCAVYNYNGTEIIGSYNDDDIYLFDTRLPSESDYIYRYEGHRNSITVKGVNFFGPRSEFVVSGSDCGNIYFWDKNTEAIVQWMRGDEEGVVNCLEPHPQVPIIATSGLDSDIKIWISSCEQEPAMEGLKKTIVKNQINKDEGRTMRADPFDNQQMRWLWRQIQRFEQRRNVPPPVVNTENPVARSSPIPGAATSTSSSSEDETDSGRPQCSPS